MPIHRTLVPLHPARFLGKSHRLACCGVGAPQEIGAKAIIDNTHRFMVLAYGNGPCPQMAKRKRELRVVTGRLLPDRFFAASIIAGTAETEWLRS